MKTPASLLVAFFIGTATAMTSSSAFAEAYLFELLTRSDYNKSWHALFLGEQHVDEWLTQYAKTKDGPATPGKTMKLGGASYQMNSVCKTHDCGDNIFYVLYAPNGSKAWGLLLKNGKNERFFGKPDQEKRNALRTAAKE